MNKQAMTELINHIIKPEHYLSGYGLIVLQYPQDVKAFLRLVIELHPKLENGINKQECFLQLHEEYGFQVTSEGSIDRYVCGHYALICYRSTLDTKVKARLAIRLRGPRRMLLEYSEHTTTEVEDIGDYMTRMRFSLIKEN